MKLLGIHLFKVYIDYWLIGKRKKIFNVWTEVFISLFFSWGFYWPILQKKARCSNHECIVQWIIANLYAYVPSTKWTLLVSQKPPCRHRLSWLRKRKLLIRRWKQTEKHKKKALVKENLFSGIWIIANYLYWSDN